MTAKLTEKLTEKSLALDDITAAAARIKTAVHLTPVLSSQQLNHLLGHEFFFKCENLQKVGAFKARGAVNTLAWLKESGNLPHKVVAYSSGNHAQAVAWAAKLFGVNAEIFMPRSVSQVKLQGTRSYGATVSLFATRQDAEAATLAETKSGAYLIPPFDHDQVICGQGTACLEALAQQSSIQSNVDAVFAPCGGGGLLSGTLIAAKGYNAKIKVFGGEPLNGNDAVRSLRENKVFTWTDAPDTLADGAKTLSITPRTMHYLKKLDGLFEIPEEDIIYWTQWLCHLLKLHIEPTAALGMAAAHRWLQGQTRGQRILIILSGGNMDKATIDRVWQTNQLDKAPALL